MRGHLIKVLILAFAAAACSGSRSLSPRTLSADDSAAVDQAVRTVESWASDPVIVREVAARNGTKMTPAQLEAINRAWVTGGERERATNLMNNPCSTRLIQLAGASRAFSAPAALDRRGASVCMSSRARDFWQSSDVPPAKTVVQRRHASDTRVRVIVAVKDGAMPIGSIAVDVDPSLLPHEHLARAEQTALPEARD